MKKTILSVLTLCMAFQFVSCDKEEDQDDINENLLIGTWLLTRETDSDGADDSYEANCLNTWTFTATQITASYDDNCDGVIEESFTENYSLSNNELVLQNSDTDDEAFVRSVTSSKLIIDLEENSDPDDRYSYTLFFDRSE